MDFYPSGGSVQPGCVFGIDARPMGRNETDRFLSSKIFPGLCSHRRSIYYFLHSIREPELFPAMSCATVEDCNSEMVTDSSIIAYMGELAQDYYTG